MQPLSGNHRPDLLTALMKMSLVLRLPRKMHLCRSSSNVPRLPSFLDMLQNPHVLLTFDKVHNPVHLPRKMTSERPKVAGTCGALYILTSKCASCHNGVHFFDIATSKSGLNGKCFLTFSLRNALRATTACTFSISQNPKAVRSWCASRHNAFTFSTSQLQKVLRTCGVFSFFTSKCASRHNGQMAPYRRCSEPTFRPSGATNH